jgi:hypothetical protein
MDLKMTRLNLNWYVLFVIFVTFAPSAWANENFKGTKSISHFSKIKSGDGTTIDDLRAYKYEVDGGYRTYQLKQKVGDYLIYGPGVGTPSFVNMSLIAVAPSPGEPIIERKLIPGRFYECLGAISFEKTNGFPIKLSVLRRLMSEEEAEGYGTPISDDYVQSKILGYWTDGVYFSNKYRKYSLTINQYKPDGQFEKTTYSKDDKNVKWEKTVWLGTWKIESSILGYGYSNKNSSGSSSSRLIQFTDNHLITLYRSESNYKRITSSSAAVAEKAFPLVISTGF